MKRAFFTINPSMYEQWCIFSIRALKHYFIRMKIENACFVVLLLFMFLVSCSKYIDYSYAVPPDKLVVMASISPQDGLNIKLTHSLAPTGIHYDTATISIRDAKVNLIVNDSIIVHVPHDENGNYHLETTEFQSAPGSRYRLNVITNQYGSTESSEIIMPESAIVTYKGFEPNKRNINGDTCIHAHFIIQNIINSKNFYYYSSRNSFDEYLWSYMLTSEFENEICEMTDYWDFHCFTNLCLNKPSDTLSFEIQTIYKGITADFVEIKISATSESLYKYIKSAIQPEGSLELAFNDPQITFTNFNNSYGVFYAENYRWLRIVT